MPPGIYIYVCWQARKYFAVENNILWRCYVVNGKKYYLCRPNNAGVVKLVDTLDLGSSAVRLGGSSPSARTNEKRFTAGSYGPAVFFGTRNVEYLAPCFTLFNCQVSNPISVYMILVARLKITLH